MESKYVHRFRQSWLNDVIKCPELARAKKVGELDHLPEKLTDSMICGTAAHAGIEDIIRGRSLGDAQQTTQGALYDALEGDGWSETYSSSTEQVFADAERFVNNWFENIYPNIGHHYLEAEVSFEKLFHEDDERIIILTGTADCVDHTDQTIWDWKTTSRKYARWENQRWAIQPTVYTWAFDIPNFNYGVLLRNGDHQIVNVTRSPANHAWLARQAVTIAKMLELELPTWPLNDAGWWCSPKWCQKWDTCKGQLVDGETWT